MIGGKMNDLTIKELRELEGLSKNNHQTLEDIARRMRPITYEPVVRECMDGDYMPEGISSD